MGIGGVVVLAVFSVLLSPALGAFHNEGLTIYHYLVSPSVCFVHWQKAVLSWEQ